MYYFLHTPNMQHEHDMEFQDLHTLTDKFLMHWLKLIGQASPQVQYPSRYSTPHFTLEYTMVSVSLQRCCVCVCLRLHPTQLPLLTRNGVRDT